MLVVKKMAIWKTALAIGFVLAFNHVQAQTVTLAADTWCPYSCQPQADRRGYIVELVKAAFQPLGLPIEYRVMPWSRALIEVQRGELAAVIAANSQEVLEHQLVVGNEPVGYARGCVFVPAGSAFKYNTADDLSRLRAVGVVGGNAYQHDFGDWLNQSANKPKIVAVYGDETTSKRISMMLVGRLDGLLEDKAEVHYVLHERKLEDKIISAGCQQGTNLYVAFSGKNARSQEYAANLDKQLKLMRKSGALRKLLASYGLQDWK